MYRCVVHVSSEKPAVSMSTMPCSPCPSLGSPSPLRAVTSLYSSQPLSSTTARHGSAQGCCARVRCRGSGDSGSCRLLLAVLVGGIEAGEHVAAGSKRRQRPGEEIINTCSLHTRSQAGKPLNRNTSATGLLLLLTASGPRYGPTAVAVPRSHGPLQSTYHLYSSDSCPPPRPILMRQSWMPQAPLTPPDTQHHPVRVHPLLAHHL